jgi:acyl-CoA hydrolase
MEGYINSAGKTSLEVEINMYQSASLKINSLFTMVARDAKDPKKGYQVPSLKYGNLSKS